MRCGVVNYELPASSNSIGRVSGGWVQERTAAGIGEKDGEAA